MPNRGRLAAVMVTVGLLSAMLASCSSSDDSAPSAGPTTSTTAPVVATYQPGTRSTAEIHPPNPVITRMTYRTEGDVTSVVANVTTQAGSPKDQVQATVAVFPNLDSRQVPPAPVFTESVPVETGENREVVLPLSAEALAVIAQAAPGIGDQLVQVSVNQRVDGDGDGTPEGSLNTRSSYHDSQVRKAGETVNLTIGTSVPGVNVQTIPTVCMYNSSDSNFAPLNTTLVNAGDYVSSSIEADGSIFDSPQYGGPPWDQIAEEITKNAAVDVVRLILGALSPVNVAVQGIVDVLELGLEDCDVQASIFTVIAAAQNASSSGQSQTTSQAYVASEQTSNGLLSAGTASAWQTNSQNEGGTVWQETQSNAYLAQAAAASQDAGLSIAATNQGVGDLTTSSTWTFTINAGGTSSIPDGCDDRLC
ncbi:MAG: hypothetical protein ACOYML_12740 [Microthrixaceae bacterium]